MIDVIPALSARRSAAALAGALLAVSLVPGTAQAAAPGPAGIPPWTVDDVTPGHAVLLLAELRDESPSPTAPPADAFGDWADADGDGCDTRSEVLIAESLVDVTFGTACTVASGEWESPWDGEVLVEGAAAVVERTVPAAEAWRSGAHTWTAQERSAFADDVQHGRALRVVSPAVSQSRADQDPSTWLPPVESARCGYVTDWVIVKWNVDLSVDPAERAAITSVLDECPLWPLFKTPFAGTIYELVTNPDRTTRTPVPLSFQRWRDVYDFAPYWRTSTMIVRYPWSATLYAATFWPGSEWDPPEVQRLTFPQWQHTGFAEPVVTDWIPGSTLHRYPTATQIFLTAPQGGIPHALTYAEWKATRFAPYEERSNEGFVKLSWDSGILHMVNLEQNIGTRLTYSAWAQLGFPTPKVVDRLPGDRVFRFFGSRQIYYQGGMTTRQINFSQWQQMGFPAPEVRDVPPRPADKDCPDYPSRFAAQIDFTLWHSEGYGDVFGLDADRDGIACEDYFGGR